MTELSNLIARLEAGEGPSRELDLQIQVALKRTDPSAFYNEKDDCASWHEVHEFGSTTASELVGGFLPHYTSSLDAAVSLVPEGMRWAVLQLPDGTYDAAVSPIGVPPLLKERESPTPALALCIAALKVREND